MFGAKMIPYPANDPYVLGILEMHLFIFRRSDGEKNPNTTSRAKHVLRLLFTSNFTVVDPCHYYIVLYRKISFLIEQSS